MIALTAVSFYLFGYVVTARLLYRHALAKIAAVPEGESYGAPWGETQGESVAVSIFWPVWLPLYWLGLAVIAVWPVLLRGLFGDIRKDAGGRT